VFVPSLLSSLSFSNLPGLIRSYYKPRWELFLNETLSQLSGGTPSKPFDIGTFYTASYNWFNVWQA